ncbi:MAG: hypothetical protein M0Z60_14325 [Nitrospiraceae bacterium]|nr:hypothetical protein [Nitrospiraceae bacterium]
MRDKKKDKLDKRLMAYAAAAAGVLAIAPAAEAAIQCSGPQNLPVNSGTTPVGVDLNGDGVTDFLFTYYTGAGVSSWLGINTSTAGGLGGTAFIGNTGGNFDAANLPAGYVVRNAIAAPYSWYAGSEPLAGSYTTAGSFNYSGAQGYIGVRFQTAAGQRFGWIQWRTDTRATQGTIIDWCYEDTGAQIAAGAGAQQQAAAVPTMNEWGLMALIALLGGASVKALKPRKEES